MKLLVAVALAAALIGNVAISQAAESSAPAAKSEKKVRQMPFRGKVSAVDPVAMTLTLEGKEKGRTFAVTSKSRLSRDGSPIALADVKVGESVGGAAVETAAGAWEITTLNIGKKADEPNAPSKKASKKAKSDSSDSMP